MELLKKELLERVNILSILPFEYFANGELFMSSDLEIAERIKAVIVEQLAVSLDQVVPQASFIEDLGADSLDIVELIMALEEEYDIEIPDEDAEKIATVRDVIEYVQTKKAA